MRTKPRTYAASAQAHKCAAAASAGGGAARPDPPWRRAVVRDARMVNRSSPRRALALTAYLSISAKPGRRISRAGRGTLTASQYRLVTRSDFDGLVCGVLLKELDLINEIAF